MEPNETRRPSDDPIHVLHVDDEPDFGEVVAHYLEREDDRLVVETATSADVGLAQLGEMAYDCVVSDYDIPGRNGIEFLDAVRAETPGLPFILFTGKGSEEIASEAISAGVTDYLQKSGGGEQYALLANRVANAVESDRSRRGAERRKRRLETLISNLPGLVYRCRNEPDWPMELVEGECHELTGYPASALESGEVVWGDDLLHPADADRTWGVVQAALDTGDSFEVTYRIVTRDGETKWVWERGREVAPVDEDAVYLEGFVTDVTDRTEREAKLDRVRDRTQALMYTETRDETARVATEAADEIIGAPLSGVHLLDDSGSVLELRSAIDRVDDVFDERPRYERGGDPGTRAALAWQVFEEDEPLVVEDSGADERLTEPTHAGSFVVYPLGRHGIFLVSSPEPHAFDETDRTLSELLATSLRAGLDRVEREAQLRQRNERLDEFTRVVSHDLRNPIEVASGHLEIVADDLGEENHHVETARHAVDRMEALVDDLLTLARKGETVTDPLPTALAPLAEESWQNVATDGARLVVETDRVVLADRGRAKQLLENLFRNAVEHSSTSPASQARQDAVDHGPSDDRLVTVGALDDGEGFYVADDGPGIPPDEREAVFDAGYSTAGGAGFGLAIVERLAEAHGWHVAVTESEAGGARFEFRGVGDD